MPHQEYLDKLTRLLDKAQGDAALFSTVVNAPFTDPQQATLLSLGVVVLLLVNKKTKTIDRIALSKTEPAQGAVSMSAKPFKEIKIPLDDHKNLIAKVIRNKRHAGTSDWQYLFVPELTAEEARFNQAGAGIGCSIIYPLSARDDGALIFSYYEPYEKIATEHHDFMKAYSKLVSGCLAN